jgi:hypothetical protein
MEATDNAIEVKDAQICTIHTRCNQKLAKSTDPVSPVVMPLLEAFYRSLKF